MTREDILTMKPGREFYRLLHRDSGAEHIPQNSKEGLSLIAENLEDYRKDGLKVRIMSTREGYRATLFWSNGIDVIDTAEGETIEEAAGRVILLACM